MPKKIEFSVISVTSEDPKYRNSELNLHGPSVKGWQSVKKCEYPQEIVLQLEKRCVLNKIQILAHQYMIPSKVELYSSNEDTNIINEAKNINWEYIGYITLATNESTEFKSRELKSANVPSKKASFFKLDLHKNHENSLNLYNQVSLIAINVIGSDIESQVNSNDVEDLQMTKLNEIINSPDYISPYDDLAFEMYVATDIAKVIRDMETKKYLAVINERFEYARKLKHAMLTLRVAGEKLGKYELEKRHAIEQEDYERARHKKTQIEQFRSEIFQELCIEELLETTGVCPNNDECSDEPDNKNLLSPTMIKTDRRSSSPNPPHTNQASPLHMPRHQSPKMGSPCSGSPTLNRGSFRRRNKSAGAIIKSTYEMYEEKPLPALRHSQTNEFLRECQVEVDYKTTSKLTEREKKQASLPILVFGTELVEKFYSKHYTDKEDGLNRLKEELFSYDNTKMHTANKTARAAIFLLHRALRDKVFSVYNLANEVIRLFFVQFVPGRVGPAEVSRSVDKLLPELLTKSGDTSARIHHMAVHTILTMADVKSVRELHIIPVHLSRPVSSSTHPRLALSRAEMVEQLILNHGISTDKQSSNQLRKSHIRHRLVILKYSCSRCTTSMNLYIENTEQSLLHVIEAYYGSDLREKEIIANFVSDDACGFFLLGSNYTRIVCLFCSGLTCRTLSEFGASGLHHPAEGVRKVSERILVLVYKVNPRMVRKQLPPDDDITRRNLLYRQLFHEFDNIDLQRKRELLERNRLIQQCTVNTNGDCLSSEPKETRNEISKCISSGNIQHIANNLTNHETNNKNNYALSKSLSGGNISQTNGHHKNDTDRQSTSSASGVSSPSNNSQKADVERHCIFCNQPEKTILLISNSMNSHYWRSCPMLVRCRFCSQVVEVATLTEHLLMECEQNEQFVQCSQCSEAVNKEKYQMHLTECNELPEAYTRCPLCHENLESTDACWKNHFMGANLCSKHTRVKCLNSKQVKIQV